ncbi:ETEC_3214 domain-containing protein [Vibrio chaetopteri]|uniref:ETEC_3214 domain-containing protein n=1 Tax=Vibrio chaetopteri TaxID=3016528 RepID=UPI003AB6DF49
MMSDIQTITPPESEENEVKRHSIKDQWTKLVAVASLVAIALGSFNDSVDALEKIYQFSLSQFTDIPSQSKLEKVYVRASSNVLDEVMGAPVYIKRSSSGAIIKYYQDSRFILSAITQDESIAAFLVFPVDNFQPDTTKSSGGSQLLNRSFSAQEDVSDLRSNLSRIATYYVEENAGGEFGNLYASVSGFSQFEEDLGANTRNDLDRLVDGMMLGEDVSVVAQKLRQDLVPNFFGYSTLALYELEEAILSMSEYQLIRP